jgi:DNA-binding GntR family transcriptional regulator
MTDEQILGAIEEFTAQHGYSPTQAEIADQFGVSVTAIRKRILRLVNAGLCDFDPARRRTLRADMKGRSEPL